MAEKKSRKTESSSKGNKKRASGKTANVSNVSSRKEQGKSAGIKTHPAGSFAGDAIAALILIAISIFTIIALNTDKTGKIGMILSLLLKGLMGGVAYILPIYLIVYSGLMLLQKVAHANSRTVAFTAVLICDLTMLNAARFPEIKGDLSLISYIVNAFHDGATLDSAGVVGMLLGRLAYMLGDISGLAIVGVLILIICLILLLDTPVSQFFDQLRIRKNQRKMEIPPEKTQAGRFSSRKDTIELDPVKINEKAAGKARKKKKKTKREDPDYGPVVIENPADRKGAKDRWEQTEKESEPDSGTSGSDGRIRQLWNAAGQGLFGGLSLKRTEDDTLPLNKRQILDYVEKETLTGTGEDPYDLPEDPEEDWGEMTIPSGWTQDASGRKPEQVRYSGSIQDVSFEDLEPEPAEIKESGMDDFEEFLWSELYPEPEIDLYEDDPFDPFETPVIEDEEFEIPFQSDEGTKASAVGQEFEELENAEDFVKNDTPKTGKMMSRSSKKAEVAAAAAGSLEEVSKEAETAASKPEKQYILPPLTLLNPSKNNNGGGGKAELREKAAVLEKVLRDFGVDATVINVNRGPSITRYEIQPATGVKVSSIVRLSDDIALNLRAKSLRIEAPIPGKAAIGIEVQNEASDLVSVREMIESPEFREASSKISFAVGKDIGGNCVIADLKKMPHMLIAGSTGSGKSVCINSILMSILFHSTPDEVKMILIDPKVVELGNYNGIPHMLIPVVTDPAKAAAALMWAVQEMEARYKKFAKEQVKNLAGFNKKMENNHREDEVMPQIVIIIDELADLMMAAAKQVEESICRLAQLARAAGMHMIVATQRPSVDVVTGLIKANVPSRIAFAVSSQVDSRTILDRAGAEKLVGNGDMLFSPLGSSHPQRLQGPFVTDEEVTAVIDFWKEQAGDDRTPEQIQQQVMKEINTVTTDFGGSGGESEDELYEDAVRLVVDSGHASASMLQRRFRIGYNRAGRLIDEMEARGIIGPSEGSRPRKVLISKEEYEAESNQPEEDDAGWSETPERAVFVEEES